MPYPPRPQLRPRPEFAGTRDSAHPQLQERLEAFIVATYREGRSLREVAELVDRSQTAVRRALDKYQVPRRPTGAVPIA
ncbi:helix-turn-helix domain containing protein [Modestobacter muralis]|uniref:Helix-turn-helix domain containing protein n=1 Tax=Modestobacter muralis TaxID=1608614 RepID=A0A6P0HCA3_9ACTN|nr:helix-turn-helix domain containing protein [Modestobacter muralis]NEN53528.1 helix-turn-helix domain containing protein [Modestobacter muralis]